MSDARLWKMGFSFWLVGNILSIIVYLRMYLETFEKERKLRAECIGKITKQDLFKVWKNCSNQRDRLLTNLAKLGCDFFMSLRFSHIDRVLLKNKINLSVVAFSGLLSALLQILTHYQQLKMDTPIEMLDLN